MALVLLRMLQAGTIGAFTMAVVSLIMTVATSPDAIWIPISQPISQPSAAYRRPQMLVVISTMLLHSFLWFSIWGRVIINGSSSRSGGNNPVLISTYLVHVFAFGLSLGIWKAWPRWSLWTLLGLVGICWWWRAMIKF